MDVLARAVLRALEAGNGRSNRCEVTDELPQRLRQDGAVYRAEDLPLALTRLEDSACIIRVHKQPFTSYPQFIVANGMAVFDAIDALAADIAAVMKAHDDEFEHEDQLRTWLDEAGIVCDSPSLARAIGQLESAGRLKRPRQDHLRDDLPLPAYWVPPKIYNE